MERFQFSASIKKASGLILKLTQGDVRIGDRVLKQLKISDFGFFSKIEAEKIQKNRWLVYYGPDWTPIVERTIRFYSNDQLIAVVEVVGFQWNALAFNPRQYCRWSIRKIQYDCGCDEWADITFAAPYTCCDL